MNSPNDISWNQIIKKEARALGSANLSEIKRF
jgi:hypothetical protein